MIEDRDLKRLAGAKAPAPGADARVRALAAAKQAYREEESAPAAQGSAAGPRLSDRALRLWSEIMHKRWLSTSALAGLVALPIAGYATFQIMQDRQQALESARQQTVAPATVKPKAGQPGQALPRATEERDIAKSAPVSQDKEIGALGSAKQPAQDAARREAGKPGIGADANSAGRADGDTLADAIAPSTAIQESETAAAPPPAAATAPRAPTGFAAGGAQARRTHGLFVQRERSVAPAPMPSDLHVPAEPNRDRVEDFKTNPVKSAEEPVSTFSFDADTASYSFVRRSLKEGVLPQPDTVRVEEMINYFPYDWKSPDTAETPFKTTVSVLPTPWNQHTKLMHVAIKGFDTAPVQPKANLVFLIDVSGSMDEPDKLPLLRSAFRMLVNTLQPEDTVSIVTYAGNAGTVLEPTKASDKEKILDAIDTLMPGGSTAGEAGIREAYRLAQQSFVKNGVNRVMLATDGDFNVGQKDDDDLKRLIEEKRKTGVFLSVFGFGRGNLNDQMMQTIAQNGNGTAAYIDTLQEAEKVLVEDASSTLFPIAKDVKIQVEFNPAKVSEYRLIGYETRALAREDFNNDKVDAGEIGSGHAVTAIYEMTPKGSPAQQIDDLRYGETRTDNAAGIANAEEYAFVKIRYKLPGGDISKLITTPVTPANEVASFDQAGTDQRFSVAIAAFGQKLRGASQLADFGYDRIIAIANAAKGDDPFGYRAEFLSLVRLASAITGPGSAVPAGETQQ